MIRARLWAGHGQNTRTGALPATVVAFHTSAGEPRCYEPVRADLGQPVYEIESLDAPEEICSGGLKAYELDRSGHVIFGSEKRP